MLDPVLLDDLKAHLRIEHGDEDAYLSALLLAAQTAAADFCMTNHAEPLSAPVRLAILLHAGHFYAQRENADRAAYEAMMSAFHALLWPYRAVEHLF